MKSFALFVISGLFVVASFAYAADDCVLPSGLGGLTVAAGISEVQGRLVQKNNFDHAEQGFQGGVAAKSALFVHGVRQRWKATWVGNCYSKSGEARSAEIMSYAYDHPKTGEMVNRLGLIPALNDSEDSDEALNQYRQNAYTQQPIESESAFLLYGSGHAQLFSRKEDQFVSAVRTGVEQGKQKLFVEVKAPYSLEASDDAAVMHKRILETYAAQPTYAYCEFDQQYSTKVTRKENTKGCLDHYVNLSARYNRFGIARAVVGVALIPYSFAVAGASLAFQASEKSPEKEIEVMTTLLKEIRAKDEPTPLLDQLYSHVIAQKPAWGTRERMVKILNIANDSFFFCEPNIPDDLHYNLNYVANMLLSGELSEDKFVK